MVEAERQAGQLMNLYVATYQLHSTLDPGEVQATIAEIAVDLLGAERFALLLRQVDGGPGCEVALAKGIATDSGPFAGNRYFGGDPLVDATLADGVLRIGPAEGSSTVAVVPLTVQDSNVGALVLLKLFDHKPSLRADDRDILDLLAAHAASALFAARVYAQTDRKLRTLESLVKLVRGT
jgi:GAF domain-containing protein